MKKQVLVSYSTSHLLKKDKVRFFYALNGRNRNPGIIQRTKTKRIGRTVLAVLPEQLGYFHEFLRYWKCKWREVTVLIP
jgi:hypothetical protein